MRETAGPAMLVPGARIFLDDRVVGFVGLRERALPGDAAFEFIDVVFTRRHVALATDQGKAGAGEKNRSKDGFHAGVV